MADDDTGIASIGTNQSNGLFSPQKLLEMELLSHDNGLIGNGSGGGNALGYENLLGSGRHVSVAGGKVSPQYLYQGLLKRGLSPTAAIATLGNWEQESSFNPSAFNPKEGAVGLDQWRLGRADSMRQLAAATGRSVTDPDLQMDYYVQELKNHPGGEALLGAKDLVSANDALKTFIGYGDQSQGTRLENAENLSQSLGAKGVELGQFPQGTSAPSQTAPTATTGVASTSPTGSPAGNSRDLLKLMLLASLGNVKLQPVDYDPYKVMPNFGA